ncbi:MAG: hypothetical protein IT190_07825 [Microbacteriaceae bacterium]|nr:hypothetical protein [Microbacteriaceae bacterium]
MSGDAQIDYEVLVKDAMRGVLKTILQRVAKTGLPGEHHFYISFNTRAPGVVLSKRLKERYPDEMTVVLQHRFWDLIVHDDRFEVKLTFDSIPERLVVPFASVRVFVDPSVRFGHQFEDPQTAEDPVDLADPAAPGEGTTIGARRPARADKKRMPAARKPRVEKAREGRDDMPGSGPADADTAELVAKRAPAAGGEVAGSAPEETRPEESAKIVSLDKFRKK